ncbi:hypothetical protein LTR56_023222 [Elasticomyces elasticus]|nr:hypothetical protein LTR56_023222 [Elasticomyces elasticus]KAK3626344.1 hypothetical protein LTR22_023211 [Elasticomyces elasticus]KAK4915969.1 hypothetical protein LTR49_016004 [Elasticomyces elasticus]KAK5760714.1 hypothetical protein LTS12_009070 [Elasticomyces elasticus]
MFSIWRIMAAVFGRLYSVQQVYSAYKHGLPKHTRWDVILADIDAGMILWLPYGRWLRDKYAKRTGIAGQHSVEFYDDTKTFAQANEGIFNHPILVISRREDSPTSIDFLLMRSFGGTTVDVKFQGNQTYLQRYYIPITPTPPHPIAVAIPNSDYQLLTLTNAMQMSTVSYVELGEVYTMNINDVEIYDRRVNGVSQTYMLDRISRKRLWDVLRRRMNFRCKKQHKTKWRQRAAETARRLVRKSRRNQWFRAVELTFMLLCSQISLAVCVAVLAWWVQMKTRALPFKLAE